MGSMQNPPRIRDLGISGRYRGPGPSPSRFLKDNCDLFLNQRVGLATCINYPICYKLP